MPDLFTAGRSAYAATGLGPPVVVHELIAVAVDPGVAVLAETPESAGKRSGDSRQKGDKCNPPTATCALGLPPQNASGSCCTSGGTGC